MTNPYTTFDNSSEADMGEARWHKEPGFDQLRRCR